jgi:uncharacterized protein (DUF427 family)
MAKAVYGDTVIAESDDTVVVEGNHYFPPSAVRSDFFVPSDRHTICPWKGRASYYSVQVDNECVEDAAWYYPEPRSAAREIKDHVAFYRHKVTIEA